MYEYVGVKLKIGAHCHIAIINEAQDAKEHHMMCQSSKEQHHIEINQYKSRTHLKLYCETD